MENQNIIITGLRRWDSKESNGAKNIAMEFSKHNKVMFVNPPIDRITRFRERDTPKIQILSEIRNGDREPMQKINDNLRVFTPCSSMESIKQINNESVFDSLNRINNRRFARDIKNGADSICFREFVLFCDSDIINSFYLIENLEPKLSLYYTHNEILVQELWKKHGYRLEPELMKKADLVFCCSYETTQQAKNYNPNAYFVGTGGDFSLPCPETMQGKSEEEIDTVLSKGIDQIYTLIDVIQTE